MSPQKRTRLCSVTTKRKKSLTRSEIMGRVRSRNTSPERLVRHLLRELGYFYRLHRKNIPGNPDIVFIGRRKAIFVHGCFWHGHDCKRGARTPKTNREYWITKISRNRKRDELNGDELRRIGWQYLFIWECEVGEVDQLSRRICDFLG